MNQKNILVILISLIILLLIAIPSGFATDLDNDVSVDLNQDCPLSDDDIGLNSLTANDGYSVDNDSSIGFYSEDNDSNIDLYDDDNENLDSKDIGLDDETYSDDLFTNDKAHSSMLNSIEEYYNDIYFNASLPDDTGDGSYQNPYKYFNASKLRPNSNIHLADGEYLLDSWCQLKNLTIIGSNPSNTILKYKYMTYNVFTLGSLVNLTVFGMYLNAGVKLEAHNVIFANNNGAIYASSNSSEVNLYNCTFINNTGAKGASIRMTAGKLHIEDCSFLNTISQDYGGAISLEKVNQSVIMNTKFIGSKVEDGIGGALFLINSSLNLSNVDFINCSSNFGGSIVALKSSLDLKSIRIINSSSKYDGGAIYQIYGNFSMSDSILLNNSASNGGALLLDNLSSFTVRNTSFINNSASMVAGGIYSIMNNFTGMNSLDSADTGNTYLGNKAFSFDDFYNTDKLNLTIGNGDYIMVKVNETEIGDLPSYYNLADDGYVTSIKNQALGGNCWAFAAMSALESCILKASGESYDFSENNMKNLMARYADFGWNLETNNGGFAAMSMAYLTSWMGPVFESEDPYNDDGLLSPLLNGSIHVQNILFLSHKNATDNDEIKRAILSYGAVAVDMYYVDKYLSSSYGYYCNETHSSNHALSVVGWNDSYSASNFKISPPGDGAWIIKNSWGDRWGLGGYFYVSYYDKTFARNDEWKEIYTFIFNDTVRLERNYQYDIGGKIEYMYNNYSTVWYKNRFIAEGNELLAAVSTYFEKETDFEISILVNGQNKHNQTGRSLSGYFTFDLDKFIPLNAGDVFEVVFKVSRNMPISIPICQVIHTLNKKTYDENESFLSYDGENWEDIYPYRVNKWTDEYGTFHAASYNTQVACIKAFTIESLLETTTSLEIVQDYTNVAKLISRVKDQYNKTVSYGNIVFNINGIEFPVEIVDGVAELSYSFDKLSNNISAIFNDVHYLNSTNSTVLSLSKMDVILDVDVKVSFGSINITVNASKAINAPLKLIAAGKEYALEMINGKASISIVDLDAGNYSAIAELSNELFNARASSNFTIDFINTSIMAQDLITSEYNSQSYGITLIDALNNVIPDRNISVSINNANGVNIDSFNVKTDANGNASIPINLSAGNYSIVIRFNGDSKHSSSEKTYSLKVRDIIFLSSEISQNINDIVITVRADKPINESLTLKLNNETYILNLLNGSAQKQFNNLENGLYSIALDLVNKEDHIVNSSIRTFELNILDSIINADDFVTASNSGEEYYIVLKDSDNNPISNKNITFSFNGEEYSRTTDSQGKASIIIDLNRGIYPIGVKFNGDNDYFASNSSAVIRVKDLIHLGYLFNQSINNLEIILKANSSINESAILYINGQNHTLLLKDGEGKLELRNLSNMNYTISSDLAIKEDYIVEADESIIEINVLSPNLSFESEVNTTSNSGMDYTVRLSKLNKGIANRTIIIALDSKEYVLITDKRGYASFPLNITRGIYNLTIRFDGDNQYFALNEKALIIVKELISLDTEFDMKGNNLQITVKANNTINESINLYVNDESYPMSLVDGESIFELKNLSNGNYTIFADLANDDEFIVDSANKTVEIMIQTYSIIANDLVCIENSNAEYNISLLDGDKKPMANKTLSILLDNIEYEMITDSQGKASIFINLTKGKYPIEILFDGDDSYDGVKISRTITVKEEIEIFANLTKMGNSASIDIGFSKPINESLYIELINKDNNVKREFIQKASDGKLSFDIGDLENGNYALNINLYDMEYYESNAVSFEFAIDMTESRIIMENLNAKEYDNSAFYVYLFDKDGNPIANKEVSVYLNGIVYNKTTDDSGMIHIYLYLKEGIYQIDAFFNGDDEYLMSNSSAVIRVLGILDVGIDVNVDLDSAIIDISFSKDMNGTVDVLVDNEIHPVNVVNGEGTLILDNLSNGDHVIDIVLEEYDLSKSKEFVIDSNYMIIADDFTCYNMSGSVYSVQLVNNGKGIGNRTINFVLDEKYIYKITDINGKAFVEINLDEGVYSIDIAYPDKGISLNRVITVLALKDNSSEGNSTTSGNSSSSDNGSSSGNSSVSGNGSSSVGGNSTSPINSTVDNSTSQGNSSSPVDSTVDNSTSQGNSSSPVDSTVDNSTSQGNSSSPVDSTVDNSTSQGNSTYSGNSSANNSTSSDITVSSRKHTNIELNDMVTTAITKTLDRNGEYFVFKLVDADGKALANRSVTLGFNGKKYIRKTDANGKAFVQVNLVAAGTYTFAVCYLGDDDYYASFSVAKITVKKQKASLVVSAKRYKSSVKTKTITASLKDSRGIAIKGKTLSFIVNGRLYTAKTNSKGIATIKVSLSKKGVYTVLCSLEDDNTFSTSTKTNKVTIF